MSRTSSDPTFGDQGLALHQVPLHVGPSDGELDTS